MPKPSKPTPALASSPQPAHETNPEPVPPAPGQGPLSGTTVVDLTRGLAGPYCTMVLADLGARVIKVEQPGSGDDSRAFGPFVNSTSAYFASLNRGKQSIALDLKAPSDRAVLDALLARADVLVENFRPGTMERHGLGWETLHEIHPRLIYAATSGFGHTGPYARRAAYDTVVQAMGGIMSMTGHPGQPPVRVGSSIGDITAGLFTAIGINAALLHRATTGEAMKVDVAMLDCQVAILENAIARYTAAGEVAGPIGARHPAISPFAAFETADGWIVLAAGNDALFQKLARALGQPALETDPRFANNASRTRNWEPLFAAIGRALKARPAADWLAALTAAEVPCGPINTIDKVLADPQVRSRNMIVTADDPTAGRVAMAGNPIKLSAFDDPEVRAAAPQLDQHRAAILDEFAPQGAAQTRARAQMPANPAGLPSTLMSRTSPLRYLDQLRRMLLREPTPVVEIGADASFRERATLLAEALLSERGEVLGTVIANELVELVAKASGAERFELLDLLARSFGPDETRIAKAADRWRADRSPRHLAVLTAAIESRRLELFRRMNMAPEGTLTLVRLRETLLDQIAANPVLAPVDADLRHLFGSWFNRGFLELMRIDWHTPAAILEKLIAYEAVHAIDGWEDLRRRLAADRRCFGFFHPSLPDEPLIFVEVALVNALADRIEPIIRAPAPSGSSFAANTAIFYSISNCQPGLKGVSLGNFLIKQVAAELASELPEIRTFATLSPIPSFRQWIDNTRTELEPHLPPQLLARALKETGAALLREAIHMLAAQAQTNGFERSPLLREILTRLAARQLSGSGAELTPADPVARFHLGNGARIERINWMADLSQKGVRESYGLMVNYLYDLAAVSRNHEAFANRQPVAMSRSVAELADTSESAISVRALMGQVDAAIGLLSRKS